ncbi:MAG: glycosyltransferase [Bradymonadia bacterium]
MVVSIAEIHDRQSAEYVKTAALSLSKAHAIEHWAQAISLDPTNNAIVSHYAVALLDMGDFQGVVDLVVPALRAQPRNLHLVNLLGVAFFRLNAYDIAARLFEYCLLLEPSYPNVEQSLRDAKRQRESRCEVAPHLSALVDEIVRAGGQKHRPSLSVCMIVKNEEEFISGAIQSVIDIADEVIVVDTGSSDKTVELATQAGATVHFFDWVGDFSAARNASLSHATTDWILVLDADERLTPASAVSLRAVIEAHQDDEDFTVFCVQVKNYTRAGEFQNDGFSGRVFRNDPALRFSGKVHEEVGRDFGTDYRLDIVFEHYGADPDVMIEKGKDERNLRLLELKLEEDPDDLVTWFYVASQHWVAHRISSAREAFERVVELFEQDPSRYGMSVVQIPVAYSYVGLVRTQMLEMRYESASVTADSALNAIHNNPDLLFQAGLAFLYAERLLDAINVLEECLKTPVAGVTRIGMHDPSIHEWRAKKMLADAYFAHGDEAQAYALYTSVKNSVPAEDEDYIVMLARLVELSSSVGQVEELFAHSLAYFERRPEEIEVMEQVVLRLMSGIAHRGLAIDLLNQLHTLIPTLTDHLGFVLMVGKVLQGVGQEQDALGWYARAAELGEDDPSFWMNFGQLLFKFDEFEAAEQAFERANTLIGAQG